MPSFLHTIRCKMLYVASFCSSLSFALLDDDKKRRQMGGILLFGAPAPVGSLANDWKTVGAFPTLTGPKSAFYGIYRI